MMIRSALVALLLLAPAASSAQSGDDVARGWGPRLGIASDPDQLLLGLHVDAGRFAPRVRFQPNGEIGVGDDFLILAFSAPAHYRFAVDGDIKPYAGGGVTVAWIDFDRDGRGDSDLEVALDIIGGAEWTLSRGTLFFLELSLVAGDVHDFELVAGWTFR